MENHRFICDDHLGKLARYLRVGGFDTVYDRDMTDSGLLGIALDENRHILTRDNRLIELTLVRDYLLITHDDWERQLRQIIETYDLIFNSGNFLSRCLEDNTPTIRVEKESVRFEIYPYTYEHHDDFRRCPACGRIYWYGSHVEAMRKRLAQLGIILDASSE